MAESRMELFIETLTGTAFELSCSPLETIMSIKSKIQYSEGIPVSQQHLIWKSQELNDDLSLQDYSINDGATLKLVLGMRGGPINTRQVSDTKKLKDIADYVERTSETAGSGGRPFTVLVFHDGDKVHMYTLMEKGEVGTVSPLSATISETSSVASIRHVEEEDQEISRENEITREKIAQLQEQLKALSINKPKKLTPTAVQRQKTSNKPPPDKSKEDFHLPPLHHFNSHSRLQQPSSSTATSHNNAQSKAKNLKFFAATCHTSSSSRDEVPISREPATSFLPYIGSAQGASALPKTPKTTTIRKYDPSSIRKPLTSGQAMPTTQKFVELDSWLEGRPRTSPEKNSRDKILYRSKLDRSKKRMKHSVKNPFSVNLSSVGRASLVMQMCGEGSNVAFNVNQRRNGTAYGKSAVESLVASGIEALKTYSLLDAERHEEPEILSDVDVKNVPQTENEECEQPPSVKKLPVIKPKKKSHKRCTLCSKKTGLATSYTCRCGKNFCAAHRYAELHECTYDYKTEGRRLLQLNNPVVAASKLPKI